MIPTKVFHSIACCVAILLSSCNSIEQEEHHCYIANGSSVGVPIDYRDIGYDSIQFYFFDKKAEVNFWHPNGLRFKKDTVYTGDTAYRKWFQCMQISPDLMLSAKGGATFYFSEGLYSMDKGYFDSIVVNGYMIKVSKVE